MPSLIIPAHNEEAVLARTLDAALAGFLVGEIDVIVVCNGCTDRSAEIAGQYAPLVTVIDLSEPSKVAALNAGDAATDRFPRVYLDADVELHSESLRLIISALEESGALAAEPVPLFDTTRSSPWVRAWYTVWWGLYGDTPGKIGSGVVGMSAQGRARFGAFPAITADDAFARAHFTRSELVQVPRATSRVIAPRTLTDLIKIKTRSRLGAAELVERFPELGLSATDPSDRRGGLEPKLWPLVPWYLAVTMWIRRRASTQANATPVRWERDESSRQM